MATAAAKRYVTTILLLLATSASAYAQTVGDRLADIAGNVWNPLFILVAVGSALVGLFVMARGLMKLVEAAQGGGRNGFGPGLTHVAIGAVLIALPDAAGIGMRSVLGAARGGSTLHGGDLDYNDGGMSGSFLDSIAGGLASVDAPEPCLGAAAPATCMAKNIAVNVIPMSIMLLFAMVFILGLIAFASAIMDIAKSSERGDQSKGHITRIVTAILLMNSPLFFTILTSTILGIDSPITGGHLNADSSLLTYKTDSGVEAVKNFAQLVSHSFTILAFFGAWAFVRGIFMIKSVAEAGRQGGSYGMAATYIVAGILLANAKFSACLILGTIGGAGMGAEFCA